MSRFNVEIIAAVILNGLISGCAAQESAPSPPIAQSSSAPDSIPVTRHWDKASISFHAKSLTTVGDAFWLCGADETIASSVDGGNNWKLWHQNVGGAELTSISFVTESVGHAAGTKGRLLSTSDGGKTWTSHDAGDDVWAFSFADAKNGIAVIGGDGSEDSVQWGQPNVMNGSVKLTRDGGDHWEDIPALSSEELRPFNLVLAVAALDPSNYLMIRRQSGIEDVFVVTHDRGKSWHLVHQRNDATNRELARWVFLHGGEYWAFGMELVHREKGGGYGVPLTLHSKDGETWIHGVNGPKEFGGCNRQGCYMWDGTVESLYGEHEQYWALPQDGTMSEMWALTQNRGCTIGEFVECGPASITEEPQAQLEHTGPPQMIALEPAAPRFRVGLPEDCVLCALNPIPWKIQQKSVLFLVANLSISPNGEVKSVLLNQQLPELGPPITEQLSHWRFKPSSDSKDTTKNIRLVVRCGFDNSVCEIVPAVAQ